MLFSITYMYTRNILWQNKWCVAIFEVTIPTNGCVKCGLLQVEWYFACRERYILLCITYMVMSCTQYINEYLIRISALYKQQNWNDHWKTLLYLSIMQKKMKNWPVSLSLPGIVHIWHTVHNCTIELSIVYEHYVIPQFMKISSLHARYNGA